MKYQILLLASILSAPLFAADVEDSKELKHAKKNTPCDFCLIDFQIGPEQGRPREWLRKFGAARSNIKLASTDSSNVTFLDGDGKKQFGRHTVRQLLELGVLVSDRCVSDTCPNMHWWLALVREPQKTDGMQLKLAYKLFDKAGEIYKADPKIRYVFAAHGAELTKIHEIISQLKLDGYSMNVPRLHEDLEQLHEMNRFMIEVLKDHKLYPNPLMAFEYNILLEYLAKMAENIAEVFDMTAADLANQPRLKTVNEMSRDEYLLLARTWRILQGEIRQYVEFAENVLNTSLNARLVEDEKAGGAPAAAAVVAASEPKKSTSAKKNAQKRRAKQRKKAEASAGAGAGDNNPGDDDVEGDEGDTSGIGGTDAASEPKDAPAAEPEAVVVAKESPGAGAAVAPSAAPGHTVGAAPKARAEANESIIRDFLSTDQQRDKLIGAMNKKRTEIFEQLFGINGKQPDGEITPETLDKFAEFIANQIASFTGANPTKIKRKLLRHATHDPHKNNVKEYDGKTIKRIRGSFIVAGVFPLMVTTKAKKQVRWTGTCMEDSIARDIYDKPFHSHG